MMLRQTWRVFARPQLGIAYKNYATMAATPFRIDVEPKQSGLLGLKLGNDEAAKVTELLQHDLEVCVTDTKSIIFTIILNLQLPAEAPCLLQR